MFQKIKDQLTPAKDYIIDRLRSLWSRENLIKIILCLAVGIAIKMFGSSLLLLKIPVLKDAIVMAIGVWLARPMCRSFCHLIDKVTK